MTERATSDASKEDTYDAEMAPLAKQLIAIAKRANISLHISARLDGDQRCTSHVPENEAGLDAEEQRLSEEWRRGYWAAAYPGGRSAPALMLTVRDGSGAVKSMEAIL